MDYTKEMESTLATFDPLLSISEDILEKAKSIKITSHDEVQKATEFKKEIVAHEKAVEEKRKGLVDPLNGIVKEINAHAKKLSQPLDEAKSIVIKSVVDFTNAEQVRVAEEQRKAQEAIRQKQLEQEAEQKRIADEQEKLRKEQEALAQKNNEVSEDEKKLQERELKIKQAELEIEAKKKAMADQAELEKQQRDAEAQAKIQQAQLQLNKPKWLTTVTDFEVVDSSIVPRAYLIVDDKKIREAIKLGATEIPGIRIFTTQRI